MKVYYYGPDNDRPSWGLGMIYYHVWLLNKNNIEATLIHNDSPFRLTWLDIDIPIIYLKDKELPIQKDDVLVVPEFHASDPWVQNIKCRKIVFVQNAFYLFDGLKSGMSYEKLGFDAVFYYMPHLKNILEEITNLPLFETPPFIAPYYFSENLAQPKKKRILVYPKFHQRDYNILMYFLNEKLDLKPKGRISRYFVSGNSWSLIEMEKLSHKEVAKQMKDALFFVSLNTTEAFNSSVPEAMAAGCVNICYDGIGPKDFLKHEENAFVFENNDIFNLSKKIVELISNYDENLALIKKIQRNGFSVANKFTVENLNVALIDVFSQLRLMKKD